MTGTWSSFVNTIAADGVVMQGEELVKSMHLSPILDSTVMSRALIQYGFVFSPV